MQGQVITDTKEKITDEAVLASNVKLIPAGTTLLSFKLSIGKTAIAGKDLYTNEAIAALIPKDREQILDKYLYYIFKGKLIDLESVGNKAFGKSLNSTYLREEVKIPVPPIPVQKAIIKECEKFDEEYKTTRMSIETYRQKIEKLFAELDVANRGGYRLSLSDAKKFSVSIGKRVLDKELVADAAIPVFLSTEITQGEGIPVFSANVIEPFGFIDKLLISDFSVPSILWGIDGDWMTSYMPENQEFYPTDHCGVLRCKTEEVNPRYLVHILEVEGRKMGFSRSYRASIDRVQGITFTVPERSKQDSVINEVFEIEKQIADAEAKLKELGAKQSEVLQKYLQSDERT